MKTKTLVFPEKWYFKWCFALKHLSYFTEKKKWTENQQLFDGIIDVTLFDGVEGLDYWDIWYTL